jgi:predicted short-subunit dehydrogenase-like oxidoreductase (DUF2520 family)
MTEGGRGSVAIVGAGRVGRALGRLLAGAGYEISEVVARRARSAREAVAFVGAGRASSISALGRVDADVVIVATPDDEIARAAAALAALPGSFEGRVALHTSGSRGGAEELGALKARGARVGSMHPLQSFSTAELGVERVRGSVFAVEGDPEAVRAARRIARDVGGRPVRLRAGAKALYHAAAVLASGGVTALLDMSLEAMRSAGLGEEEALAAALPLVRGTLANVEAEGAARALTGPHARGDEGTVARNRAALAALDPRTAEVYDLLGDRARELARRRGSRPPRGRA